MIDIFLTVFAIVAFVLIWGACVYGLAYFQHPADNRTAYFPKVVVVLTFAISATVVLMLPLDVAQRNSKVAGLPMEYLWMFTYCLMALLGVIIIPFAIFYYEAEDEKGSSQLAAAFKGIAIILVIFGVLLTVGYIFLGVSLIPIKTLKTSLVSGDAAPNVNDCGSTCNPASTVLKVKLSVIVFIITFLSMVGWLLLAIFGGIGFVALPFDLVRSYLYRPLPITRETYDSRKIKIGEEAEGLLKRGLELQGKYKKSASRKDRNEWKKEVYAIDRDFVHNEVAYKKKGGPAIFYWIKLALGILAGIMTLLWILQIILWTNLKIYPFINNMFVAMDGIWQFFGTLFFSFFAFYMVIIVIKGNFKWGIRVPFLAVLHPMKVNATMQNSLLVNGVLVLLASVAITQFLADSFSTYVRATAINSIFNLAVKNLRGIYYYWLVLYWALPSIAVLTLIYFIVRPNDARTRLYMAAQRGSAKKDDV